MTAPPGYAPITAPPHRQSREDHEAQLCQIVDAPSLGAATAALISMAPDWSVSRCSRVAAAIRTQEAERVSRAVLYTLLPTAPTDVPWRGRGDGEAHHDPTRRRATHNLHVRSGQRI